ncbi:MAG: glycosyl hydrolase-related protein, partial [Microcystaceae cyanobacterium]
QTVRQGYQLNRPLRLHFSTKIQGSLSPSQSFLNLESNNLCLMAFKQAEDDPKQWILRFYEYQGEKTDFYLDNSLNLNISTSVNLLEQETKPIEVGDRVIKAWQIVSFKLQPLP